MSDLVNAEDRFPCDATHTEARLSLDIKSFMRQIAVSVFLHDKRMIVFLFVSSLVTKIV